MIDRTKLMEQAKKYVEKHPPNKGNTLKAMELICTTDFPKGTNLLIQFALQFDGKMVGGDLVAWDAPRLPYLASWSLDKGADCADFIRNVVYIFFNKNIGEYTEAIWQKYHTKEVPWEQRREGDVIGYKFSSRNPHLTHVSLYIGNGKILHTTSQSNPLRVENDSYGKSSRVGVYRVLTDSEYESLICDGTNPTPSDNGGGGGKPDYASYPILKYKKYNNGYVKIAQKQLNKFGYNLVEDGDFGLKTLNATRKFQKIMKITVDGKIGQQTWGKLFTK
jgi:cell wall-associated NlpC family hydrolase